jgi:F-box interacting protein
MSDYLPDDVVVDILQRLPVKSLLRFRCVCRSWNTLIKTPSFIHSHLNQSIENHDGNRFPHPPVIVRYCASKPNVEHYKLFRDNESFEEDTELDFSIESCRLNHFRLIGSENGLMCFLEQDRFILWNPSIKKFVNLPKPCITLKTHGRITCNQAFGFDPRTNDYKVVRIAFPHVSNWVLKETLVEIYSLSTGRWKISGASFPYADTHKHSFKPKACLNGSVHFMALAGQNRTTKIVLAFDLRDEVFREMILPDNMVGSEAEMVTCVFKGSLALLCYDRWKRCLIWVMKEYDVVDSWMKQFTIDIAGGVENVLGFRKNGQIILETRKIGYWELSSYDPVSQRAMKLGIYGRAHYFCFDTYRENLVLLNQANDALSRSGVTKKRKNR